MEKSDIVHVGVNFEFLEAWITLEFTEQRLKESAEEQGRGNRALATTTLTLNTLDLVFVAEVQVGVVTVFKVEEVAERTKDIFRSDNFSHFVAARGVVGGSITMTLDVVEDFLNSEWRIDSHLLLIRFPSRRWSTSASFRLAMVGFGWSRGTAGFLFVDEQTHLLKMTIERRRRKAWLVQERTDGARQTVVERTERFLPFLS